MMELAIKKLVNKEDLTAEEVREIINFIMKGEATSSQIGAFLMGLRMKGENFQEILGAVKGLRDNMTKLNIESETLIDTCGTGGDGGKTFNISTAVAIIAASGGVKVAKHGNRAVSSKSGSADVLEALGIKTNFDEVEGKKQLEEVGMSFLFAPNYHKAMKNVAKERRELGTRTIFNILGPLANPAPITGQLMGVFDGNLIEKVGKVLLNLGLQRAIVVYGEDGLDEITITTTTRVCEVRDGEIKTYSISPEDFSITRSTLKDIAGGTAEENAKIIVDILNGDKGPKRDIVLLNSAAALYVGMKVASIKEGLKLAEELIDSGKALAKYKELVNYN